MAAQGDGGITWCDETWNPVRGCTRVSEGCRNCYAERVAARFSGPGQPYDGLARATASGPRWTGKVVLVEDHLMDPLRWRRPRRVFVNSMSDLFHESLTDEQIDQVVAVMALAPQHTFQVLTKRAARMRDYLAYEYRWAQVEGVCVDLVGRREAPALATPVRTCLPNVWWGVSAEDQATADERIPLLLQAPAAVRWVSLEPLLGAVDASRYTVPAGAPGACRDIDGAAWHRPGECPNCRPALDWVVIGGESGPDARPMHPGWALALRDQCVAAGVAFHFKQWGEWAPMAYVDQDGGRLLKISLAPDDPKERVARDASGDVNVIRVGKKAAGRLLDGRTWDEFPK